MNKVALTNTYERYPEYKDSGVEWLGHVPKDWSVHKVKEVFEFSNEKGYEDQYNPLSVTYGGIKKQIENAAKVADGSARKLVRKGDIVINSRSDRKGAVGQSEYEGVVSLVYNVLRSRSDDFSPKYFHYLFRSKDFSEEFYRWGRGIVDDLWTTRSNEMKNILITVPSKPAQEKIAGFLDKETERIDAIIAKKQRLIELLKEKRTATINHAVTKGLDPKAEMVDSGVEWIGYIPKDWEVKKIKHTISSITAGVWGEEPVGDENDIKCLRVADFDYDNLSYSEVEPIRNNVGIKQSKVLKKNDLLIEKSGGGEKTPVGRVVVFKGNERMTCANFIEIVRTDQTTVDSEFLGMYLCALYASGAVRKYIKQNTGIQNLDIKSYFSESICLPPLDEQKKIVAHIQGVITSHRSIELKINKSIQQLQELKSSLISHAVTGKIKV